jgi:hypothetical protein
MTSPLEPDSGVEAYKPVPVDEARRISDLHAKDWVVILANDDRWDKLHSTTFGVEPRDKITADKVAQACLERLGYLMDMGETFDDLKAELEREKVLRRAAEAELAKFYSGDSENPE